MWCKVAVSVFVFVVLCIRFKKQYNDVIGTICTMKTNILITKQNTATSNKKARFVSSLPSRLSSSDLVDKRFESKHDLDKSIFSSVINFWS